MSITGNMEQKRIKGKVSEVVKVDRTLTKSGYAADSKVTGEALEARVRKAEIANNLTTDNPNRVLSASQGVELKRLIDELAAKIDG